MPLADVLDDLRELERMLRSAPVQDHFRSVSAEERAKFVGLRQEVSVLVGRLTNAQLAGTAEQLDALAGEFQSGMADLQARLTRLDETLAFLHTLAAVVGVGARIALLVG